MPFLGGEAGYGETSAQSGEGGGRGAPTGEQPSSSSHGVLGKHQSTSPLHLFFQETPKPKWPLQLQTHILDGLPTYRWGKKKKNSTLKEWFQRFRPKTRPSPSKPALTLPQDAQRSAQVSILSLPAPREVPDQRLVFTAGTKRNPRLALRQTCKPEWPGTSSTCSTTPFPQRHCKVTGKKDSTKTPQKLLCSASHIFTLG